MDETTEAILDDCQNYGISDMDSFVVWKLGVAAWKKAKDLGARWPHE
jgi:hypothetical protein